MTDVRPQVTIYTDGGSKPNPGPGGWAAILVTDGEVVELSDGEKATTNNRMELKAAISALESLQTPSDVTIYTDSVYLKNGITRWMHTWVKNGWQTSSRQPVKNRDLWEKLHAALQNHTVSWRWVKGHAGNRYNERADRLATAARQRWGG